MAQTTPASNLMQEFDTEFLLHAPEIYIFSACRHVVDLLVAAQTPARTGGTRRARPEEQVSRLFSELSSLAQATQRFDIVVPVMPEAGFSPFFWRWFNWWHDYRQGLRAEELDLVHRLQEAADPGALDYRPHGDWLSYRATPPFGLLTPREPQRRKRSKR